VVQIFSSLPFWTHFQKLFLLLVYFWVSFEFSTLLPVCVYFMRG
jgi:hypothetical protein